MIDLPKSASPSPTCSKCGKPIRECWCFADDNAPDGCRCSIPNAGLPLTVIEFLGCSPVDLVEYRCAECMCEFYFRASDWKTRADYLEPKFCRIAGRNPTYEEKR